MITDTEKRTMKTIETPTAPTTDAKGAVDTPCIQVQQFEFFYGKSRALHGITLDIPHRKVTAFIGPSGCGKSTLLRSINRMNDLIPDTRHTGDIRILGRTIYDASLEITALRGRVGMVFQKSTPFPKSIDTRTWSMARAWPASAGRPSWTRPPSAARAQERGAVGRGEGPPRLARHKALRRPAAAPVCIARAVAVRPEILLMDEP